MEVKIKVLWNGKEIEEAKAENQKRQSERVAENQKPKSQRVEILDVEVPEKELKEQPRHFNRFDVDWFTISQNNMIFITLTNGEKFEAVRDKQVEKQLAEAIELKEKASKKQLELK